MAATVLNGSGNLSYTNNTGGNVRAIIYYMSSTTILGSAGINLTSSFGTASATSTNQFAIGKDLAAYANDNIQSVAIQNFGGETSGGCKIPTQIMLADGQSLSALCGGYNIAIIPENG